MRTDSTHLPDQIAEEGSTVGTMPERIILGGLQPTLTEQGLAPFLAPDDLKRFEDDNRAIGRLSLRSLITYSQGQKAYEKLSRNIANALRNYRKPGVPR